MASPNLVGWLMRPASRFIVGLIAIPLVRAVRRRLPGVKEWDTELEKDIDQWFRASLLLLVATKNTEAWLISQINLWLEAHERLQWQDVDLNQWYIAAGRLLLAIGVVESMPDQALFAIIHPGPKWRYNRLCSLRENIRTEWWPLFRGLMCQHLSRSSPMFAILSVFFGGVAGWVFYCAAIVQYLIIGLVTSRDRALDVLSEFDRVVAERREEIIAEFIAPQEAEEGAISSPPAAPEAGPGESEPPARTGENSS